MGQIVQQIVQAIKLVIDTLKAVGEKLIQKALALVEACVSHKNI